MQHACMPEASGGYFILVQTSLTHFEKQIQSVFFMILYSFLVKKEDMDFLEISPDKVFPFAIPVFPDSDDDLVSSKPHILWVSRKGSLIHW